MVDATLSLQKKTEVLKLKAYYFCVLCGRASCNMFCVLLAIKEKKICQFRLHLWIVQRQGVELRVTRHRV